MQKLLYRPSLLAIAITGGQTPSDDDCKLLVLPAHLGDLGIHIFTDICAPENGNSKLVCQYLTETIIHQNNREFDDSPSNTPTSYN
jgi:hypothetical protein